MKFKALVVSIVIGVLIGITFKNPIGKLFSNEQDPISINTLTGKYDPTKTQAYFHKNRVNVPNILDLKGTLDVLGKKNKNDERIIKINLSNQELYAYEGDKKIWSFKVSTGKWSLTPTGEFKIWTKLRYVLMTGGSKALGTYYYLPNVPYTMFFYNGSIPQTSGYAIHGTYWHNNFGHPMSHGCVNMKTEEAGQLFNWAEVGTKVIIYGETPKE